MVPTAWAYGEGVASDRVVVPLPTGWKASETLPTLPVNTTGLVVTVPTAVFELCTGTEIVAPGRTFCVATASNVEGLRATDSTLNPKFPDKVVVEKDPIYG